MVIKNLETNQAGGHHLLCVPHGLHHHLGVEHLDGALHGDGRAAKVYVLDGNVPILVNRTTMEETLDVEAKSHIEMFHHYFFTLAPDDKYIRYSMEKAMYLVDETGLAQYNTLKERAFTTISWVRVPCSASFATASSSTRRRWSSPTTVGKDRAKEQYSDA